MFIYYHIDNEKLKKNHQKNSEKKLLKKKIEKKKIQEIKIKSRTSFHDISFTTCHSYLMLHGEILFSRLYPRIKKWVIHCKPESA